MAEKLTNEELKRRIKELEEEHYKHKQAEKELIEEKEFTTSLIDNAPTFFVAIDSHGKTMMINQHMLKTLGYKADEVVGKDYLSTFIPERDRNMLASVFNNLTAKHKHTLNENHVHSKDGREFLVEWHGSPVFDTNGEFKYFYGIGINITNRKRAEEALRESEGRYRSLFKNNHSVMLLIDPENADIVDANPAAISYYGWTHREFTSKKITDINTLTKEQVFKEMEKAKAEQRRHFIFRHRLSNGDIRDVEVYSGPIKLHDQELLYSIIHDITQRKQAEEALRKSEEKLARSRKMESLGLLAGGVAHDLNNVLSGIVSYPDLILLDLPEDSELRKPIETMQASGQRAAAIVQDLLTVARGVASTKEPLNLNDLTSDYVNSPEFKKLDQFHPTVSIKTSLTGDLFNVNGSHVHIRKAIMNLVSNAAEAVVGSGNITISTMNRYVDRPLKGYDDVDIGEYVILSVSDNGSGISTVDLERIFEPFYTKKVMGRSGTGLGLAVVWNVVQDHKGYIDVITDEKGTTFELYFPITRDEILGMDLDIPIEDFQGDGETILVVDDVENQRDICCVMLDTLGYKTDAVSSGEEAVEYVKENIVDLLLIDMIMDPGINGRETYERIIKFHPNQKAIIVSGFAETDDVKETQKLGAGKYIKKPVTLKRIGLAVKEELEK
ncbi:PAS domain S-box protein [Thermodesulfobacteriota bacterium]